MVPLHNTSFRFLLQLSRFQLESDNTSLNFNNWARSEPRDYYGKSYVRSDLRGLWYAAEEIDVAGYICESKLISTIAFMSLKT